MSATVSNGVHITGVNSFSWSRAITAGFIATIVITISMALFGMNIMKSLGMMMLPNASPAVQYVAGGTFHLMVGLFWGVLYAWLFGKVAVWGPFLKGTLYGLAITAIALAVMPLMAMIMPGGTSGAPNPCNPCATTSGAANPCNPCAGKAAAANPCNPCAAKSGAKNPCNPCAAKSGANNPCNPCAPKSAAANPCNPCKNKAAANPCAPKNACSTAAAANPCNPCGGNKQNPFSGAVSAINHLLFGLTLAFAYRPRPGA